MELDEKVSLEEAFDRFDAVGVLEFARRATEQSKRYRAFADLLDGYTELAEGTPEQELAAFFLLDACDLMDQRPILGDILKEC